MIDNWYDCQSRIISNQLSTTNYSMNIKTTIVLLVLLLGVGAYVFITRDKGTETDDTAKHDEHTLLDVKDGNITRFSITGPDGKVIAAEKSRLPDGMDAWKLTEPVKATAETYKVSSLLTTLTGLKSTEQIPSKGTAAMNAGLDKPRYTIDLTANGAETTLLVGGDQAIGGGVYVQVKGHDQIDVVSASVLDPLQKSADSLRSDRLFDTAPASVQQLTITRRDGSKLVMEKGTTGWLILKPQAMPGDASAIEDLASTVINMQPVSFVDDPSDALGLAKPEVTVTFSTAPPSTQPTSATTLPTTMANAVKVIFGSYDDFNKKNVFAQVPDGTIVKVAASVLESLNKTPLDLRDKTVLNIDPALVNKVVITSNQPATTQPIAAAVDHTLTLQRRPKDALGPPVPIASTTRPTTGPASTMPITPGTMPVLPEAPKTDWQVAGPKPMDADDAKIATLLGQFHPLKGEKFLEKQPAGRVVKTYTVSVSFTGQAGPAVLTLIDTGNDGNLIGTYNGLTFEVLRSVASDFGSDFLKPATPTTPPVNFGAAGGRGFH
jgi:hypothetical protein